MICYALIYVAILIALSSCSAPHVTTFPTLANQGQLALSTSNPYLGANLFLSKELEHSGYLYNFFQGRGAPTAIEIEDDSSAPTRVIMYYPLTKEVYIADLHIVGETIESREWVVRGPYAVSRKDYKNLQAMQLAMNGEPVFEIAGKLHRFRFDRQESPREVKPLPPPMPTPRPTPRQKKKVVYQSDGEDGSIRAVDPKNWKPLNTDQQALMLAKGFAERAANGDVIHTVRQPGETIALIAKWYTGTGKTANELATLNGAAVEGALQVGRRISVPLGLVKQFKQMPDGFK